MIKFKACPKCHGDLCLGKDMFGKYLSCFQCGYLRDLAQVPAVEVPVAEATPATPTRTAA